jgi:TRAP-type mannitol/chloroaromatic compound transport system permease small subunit
MAGVGQVHEDGSFLSRIDKKLYQLESTLALASGLAIFSLMLLAVVSVAGWHFFNMSLPGYVDWIEQAMPLIAFMGIAYTQRNGGHIRMDMLVARLSGRAL